jgi:L-ascorbate metabolism protein UlaG (beta-lactamase superfamily)
MCLTKFEQSGFIFETDSGYRLALDIGTKTPLEKLNNVSVDVMLVSHLHPDHFSLDHIKKLAPKKLYLNSECIELLGEEELPFEIVQIKSGETVDIGGIAILPFDVDHGPNVTPPKENFGFLLEADNTKIYFAGDMFYFSGIDVPQLEVDIALIPVGTFYTFGPQEAFDFIKQFKKIDKVIPMHYEKNPQTREEFIKRAVEAGFNTESFAL